MKIVEQVEYCEEIPSCAEALELYGAVGWQEYTKNPDILMAALSGSLKVICARYKGKLVGLSRIIGDGKIIIYLADILVNPKYHRNGIGTALVQEVFSGYEKCRQHVLLTDNEPFQRSFYQSLGFIETRDFSPFELRCFLRFNN